MNNATRKALDRQYGYALAMLDNYMRGDGHFSEIESFRHLIKVLRYLYNETYQLCIDWDAQDNYMRASVYYRMQEPK